ncbi:MAG: YfhO family protein [Chloroflexi bacterium]|nr:YfhO family protein [Chloroflexota bacterium]
MSIESETVPPEAAPAASPPSVLLVLDQAVERVRAHRLVACLTSQAPWFWPYGALCLVMALVVWPAWLSQDRLISGGDAVIQHYPWFVLWRDALAAGQFPFWNPYTFSGLPAFATPQAGYGYPFHWALTWLPAIPAINWTIGLHVLLAGLGAAWCAGRLGASREGQYLCGLAYGLGSVMAARMWAGHLSFIESNAWLPFATGLAIGARRRHAVALLAIASCMMVLGAQPELLIFSIWWLPLWAGVAARADGAAAVVRAAARAVVGFTLGVGLAAFQLLPTLQLVGVSNRLAGMSWDFRTGASLPLWHLLTAFAPEVFGPPDGRYWPGPEYEWHERLFFIGIVPLLASFVAPRRWRWVCWGFAALAVALAAGRYVPWYAWTRVLPGYQLFRIPSKHLLLAALALSLAGGLGLERLRGRRVALVALGSAILLGVLAQNLTRWLPAASGVLGGSDLVAAALAGPSMDALGAAGVRWTALVLGLLALIALLPAPWSRRFSLVLATAELALVLQPYRTQLFLPGDVLAGTEALSGRARAAVLGGGAASIANFGPILHVTQPGGYANIFSAEYMTLLTGGANAGVVIDPREDQSGLLYLLGYGVLIDRDKHVVTVLQPEPPRVWVARCTWPGGAREAHDARVPRLQCVTRPEATDRQQPVAPGPARLVAERAGWLQIEAEGPGWLVTDQPWYPGWSVSIDGEPSTVATVDGALVGVLLPPGDHAITLDYRPAGLDQGIAISAGVALLIGALSWLDRRRTARPSRRAA